MLLKTMLAFLFLILFADSTGVPPGWVDIITLVVGVGLTVFLKYGPIPSRVVAVLGFAAGLIGFLGPKIYEFFPAGSHAGGIVATLGFVIVFISERVQGGVTVPGKRDLANQGEM